MADKENAAKLVSSALLGYDCETVFVGGKGYIIEPPTIKRLVGASYYLSDLEGNVRTISDLIGKMTELDKACRALSWFINGDESLADELQGGTLTEVTMALTTAYSLLSTENFIMLSTLAKSVGKMIAKQRP